MITVNDSDGISVELHNKSMRDRYYSIEYMYVVVRDEASSHIEMR